VVVARSARDRETRTPWNTERSADAVAADLSSAVVWLANLTHDAGIPILEGYS
jgi:hypothetical protein